MRFTLLFLFVTLFTGSAFAQSETTHTLSYEAFLQNDPATWRQALARIHAQPASLDNYLNIGRTAYGAAGTGMALEDYTLVENMLDTAEAYLEVALEQAPEHPTATALLAGCWGLRIALKPIRGMTLGSKISRELEGALQAAPDDPMVHYQLGMSRYNTPAAFGGDLDEAIEHFQRARLLMEEQCPEDNWAYLAAHAWLSQALRAADRPDEARAVLAQALRTEPRFGWGKYLMQQLSK